MTDWLIVHIGDNRVVLPTLPERSVHCVVTSPPYWGLRDYGTATWEGGDEGCDHVESRALKRDTNGGLPPAGQGTRGTQSSTASSVLMFRDTCRKCGARRVDAQLGLEATPEQYVENLVAVFREVRRVLRDDGTVWLNLGDSYAGSVALTTNEKALKGKQGTSRGTHGTITARDWSGLKPKDLVGIPWRVAFALQADGWYLRSDIIWSKPNPMPESVTDRPTKAHEYVFLLAKSARYYFDADAVREAVTPSSVERLAQPGLPNQRGSDRVPGKTNGPMKAVGDPSAGRNIRSVWTIATQPYPGAHFAVFPEALVEPCIKAGCPEGGTVLDPFGGSGTVGRVANKLSRRAVLIELNPDYGKQIEERNLQAPLGLAG